MSETLAQISTLVALGQVRLTLHGFRELAADDILIDDVLSGVASAVVVEDYLDATRGPTILVRLGSPRSRGLGYSQEHDGPSGPRYSLSTRPDAVVGRLQGTQDVMTRTKTELIREGRYAAEVSVDVIEDENGWSPYLSLGDARRLEAIRLALRAGDIAEASKHGRVYELTPLSA